MPAALEPPPTQAMTYIGQLPIGFQALLAGLAPMIDWKSRTIIGNGCGPTTLPMM